ncbi:DUF4296 domain-containing protein [Echinicola vietnamensis]|uniref:DUF4296 domain-containing protein n=1 Tax=Echinicola vietnamensis (strain DSM 17526 / LMG 23754 / KMM 6221) TaxID=926556 RepID=L0FZR9_ECHVK|nr:DUF4296 domain-containing protein [Echinicola vietnamensis]AGA78503.1 hypothetical protein Echvi_2255 [Echinicola vietnamensis DSM 17526]
MKKTIFFFVFVIGVISCGDDKAPPYLLSEDEMVGVMVDIHMAEGMASSLPVSYDSSKKLYPLFESRVFEKHQVTDTTYTKSLEFYLRDTEKMKELYGRVIDSLNVKEKIGQEED